MSIPFRLLIPREHYEAMLAQAQAELPNECCGLLAGSVRAPERPAAAAVLRASGERTANPGGAAPAAQAARETDRIGVVLCRYPLVNNAASPKEYLAHDRVLFNAFRDMRQRGLDLLAVYHSHPLSNAVPSQTDLERNYFDDVVHLIISLQTETPVLRGWWLGKNDYREAEWEVAEPGSLEPPII